MPGFRPGIFVGLGCLSGEVVGNRGREVVPPSPQAADGPSGAVPAFGISEGLIPAAGGHTLRWASRMWGEASSFSDAS